MRRPEGVAGGKVFRKAGQGGAGSGVEGGRHPEWQVIFDTLSDAVCVLDSECRITKYNRAMADLFGSPGQSLTGRHCWEVCHGLKKPVEKCPLTLMQRPDRRETTELIIGDRTYEVVAEPCVDDESGFKGAVHVIRDATERQRVSSALHIWERAIHSSINAIAISDLEGKLTYVNPSFVSLWGYERPEEILGRRAAEFWQHESDAASVIDALRLRGNWTGELTGQRKDGSVFPVELSANMVKDVDERPVCMMGSFVDITKKRFAETAMRESEQKLRNLIEVSSDWIWEVDDEGVYTFASSKVKDILGYAPEEIVGRKPFDLMPPDEACRIAEIFKAVVASRKPIMMIENINLHRDGRRVLLETSGVPVIGKDGAFLGYRGIDRDITERKRVEEELRASEERYRDLVENASVWIWETDSNLRHVYTNLFVTECLGYRPDEFLAADIFTLVHPEDHGTIKELIRRATVERKGWNGAVLRWRHKDGSWRHIESSGKATFNAEGKFLGLSGVDRDITASKEAEEALRESETRFRQLAENIKDVFWLGAPDWSRVYYISPSYELVWGRQCDELYRDSLLWLESVIDEDRKTLADAIPGPGFIWEGEVRFPEYRIVRPDGTVRWIAARAYPIRNAEQAVTAVAGIAEDITLRKEAEAEKLELERQLMQSQRLESLGVLAGGIAHDFNNLLQGVFGYISLAKMRFDEKERALAMLDQAEKALHQTVSLSSQLLTFSKGGKPLKKKLDLRPLIENTVRFALSGSSVEFDIRLDADLRIVDADEGQIGQVIQNLVINADQAMPMGGRIMVTAKNVHARGEHIPVALAPGDYVEVSVQDGGIGMPAHYLQRVFDPYFTTKEKGSGLGLAISYSIVRNHGGTITATSELGKGSTFSVYLPATEEAPIAAKGSQEVSDRARKGRILLMDDEELLRDVASEMITALGHEVDCAEDGEEAVAKYLGAKEGGRPYDIVILDLTVRGGMGGADTIKRLLEIDPQVMAIVSSGYADDSVIADYRSYGFRATLSKPYRIEALSRTLDALFAM